MVIFVNLLENVVQEEHYNSHYYYNVSLEQKACNKLPDILRMRLLFQQKILFFMLPVLYFLDSGRTVEK